MEKEKQKLTGLAGWIEDRFPLFAFLNLLKKQNPKNLNYAWNFGSMALLFLVVQIVTGIFLTMHYTPHVDYAFDSVEKIMRDVHYGWLIRYTHAAGASFFFIVVYLHMARNMYYGSYKSPREILWFFGVILFLAMMATAFMGYVLPWGQMSFWGATVITNLFSAIPVVGDFIVSILWGGFSVDNPTLNRFFALHYLLPFVILGLTVLHVVALFSVGANNPAGVEPKSKKDTLPFFPYFVSKDMITVGIGLGLMFFFVCFAPNFFNHADNYIEANPLVTPEHIVPEWYFLPFYAILRAIPNKLLGVIAMFGSILILFALPWLDTHKVKSAKYRPVFRKCVFLFIGNFLLLMWLGGQEAIEPYVTMSQFSSLFYFSYFIVILPLLGKYEQADPLPSSIHETCPHLK